MSTRTSKIINIFLGDYIFNFFNILNNFDSHSSITVFPWFHQPRIPFLGSKGWLILRLLDCFFILDNLICSFVVFLNKIFIFFISNLLDMKSHWDILKGVHFLSLIIILKHHYISTFMFMKRAFLFDKFQLFSRWLCITIALDLLLMILIFSRSRIPLIEPSSLKIFIFFNFFMSDAEKIFRYMA